MKRVLLIDNYDSFTYNLAQYFGQSHAEVLVHRNDQMTFPQARRLRPTHLVISPGPGSPKDARISNTLIRKFAGKIPILGVCLGHQCIGEIFGGRVVRAKRLMHGKTSRVYHDQKGVYRGLPNPFEATRYHSLIVSEEKLPSKLEITAHTSEGEIMGLRVRGLPIEGVQFHPESIMTKPGLNLLRNFLDLEA
jgi:anthranilate synthase/aminodeoxychorismate synthase-like glutamine amidotransferase